MALPTWSDAEAEGRFGWTARRPGHGHLYRVAVTVGGVPDATTGLVMNLAELDALLADRVVTPFADQDLNQVVTAVAQGVQLPGCEVLAADIWQRLVHALPGRVTLERVVVQEDDTLEAECVAP